MTWPTRQNLSAGTGPAPQYTFNSYNQITGAPPSCTAANSYCYDAAGNLLNDSFHQYSYDAENRLISVDGGATKTYKYDALGHRVGEYAGSTGDEFLFDLNGHPVTDLNVPTGNYTSSHIFVGGRHFVEQFNSTTYFALRDWLGNERTRTDLSGNKIETCTNFAFGDSLTCAATDGLFRRLHFTGQVHDWADNLDHFQFRQYSNTQGTWMHPDPDSFDAVGQMNPQTWNRYAYVINHPLSYTDPLGLECVWDDGSYDSEFDSQTGSVGGCGAAGGTWVELGQNGNWSGQADQWNQNLVASIQAGQVGQVDILGQNGFTYQTMYNGGQTTETVTPDATTFYSYGQPVTSVSQMIDTALCGLCHSNNFVSIFTPQQIQQFALTHGWSRDFFDPLHKNWWNGGLQLRSNDKTCSTHMSIDLSASAAM